MTSRANESITPAREPSYNRISGLRPEEGKTKTAHKHEEVKGAECLLFLMWYSFHDHDDPLGINVQPKRAKTQP